MPACPASVTFRPITDGEDAVHGARLQRLQQPVNGFPFFVKANRDGAIAPWIVELIAAIGRIHELDVVPFGGTGEHAGLIAGGGGQQQNTFHNRATCSAVGSAQQYQGSFRYGTEVRGAGASGDLVI